MGSIVAFAETPSAAYAAYRKEANKSKRVARSSAEEARLRLELSCKLEALRLRNDELLSAAKSAIEAEKVIDQFNWLIERLREFSDRLPQDLLEKLDTHEWAMSIRKAQFRESVRGD